MIGGGRLLLVHVRAGRHSGRIRRAHQFDLRVVEPERGVGERLRVAPLRCDDLVLVEIDDGADSRQNIAPRLFLFKRCLAYRESLARERIPDARRRIAARLLPQATCEMTATATTTAIETVRARPTTAAP